MQTNKSSGSWMVVGIVAGLVLAAELVGTVVANVGLLLAPAMVVGGIYLYTYLEGDGLEADKQLAEMGVPKETLDSLRRGDNS